MRVRQTIPASQACGASLLGLVLTLIALSCSLLPPTAVPWPQVTSSAPRRSLQLVSINQSISYI